MKKLAVVVCLGTSLLAIAFACTSPAIDGTCAGTQTCPVPDGGSVSEAGQTKSDSAAGDGEIASDGAAADGGCDPTQSPLPQACIGDTLAIFVSSAGDDSNAGTMEQPVQTISHALVLARTTTTHRVIACAGSYPESITLTAPADDVGLALFGGAACSGSPWTYPGTPQAVVTSPGPGPALQATGLTQPLTVDDVEFDGPTVTAPGSSSIGVFMSTVMSAGFTNVKIVTQNGANGAGGTTGNNYPDGGVLNGNNATDAGPGAAVICTCEDGTQTTGGAGGDGSEDAGAGGGLPAWGEGVGGTHGQVCLSAAVSNGNDAPTAAQDAGAPAVGVLSGSGWTSAAAANGNDGPPGQGGGGGGDGKAGPGAGGGGGCGGCGGAGGTGGQAGGSSITVLAYHSTVTLTKCILVSGSAGAGGNGATGQAGQAGESGGSGTAGNTNTQGCQGGGGGAGAGGNGGAGGPGGISAGAAYTGTPPTVDGNSLSPAVPNPLGTLGNGGGAGAYGNGGAPASGSVNAGAPGLPGAAGIAQAIIAVP